LATTPQFLHGAGHEHSPRGAAPFSVAAVVLKSVLRESDNSIVVSGKEKPTSTIARLV
jgi:hypothetical protein